MAPAADSQPKQSVIVSPQAFVTMTMHATNHSRSVIHGILIGTTTSSSSIKISEAIPVCHETPTMSIVESALALVQAQNLDNDDDDETKKIIGWFTAPELLEDDKPEPVALRIVSNLATNDETFEPVLLVIQNSLLGELLHGKDETVSASKVIKAFGKDFGSQWMEPLELTVTKETGAAEAAREAHQLGITMHDLIDHWESSMESEWNPAVAVKECVQKHC